MSETVIKELIAENEGLREKLAAQGNVSYAFQIVSLSKPIRISGVLIAEGVWKGIKYSYEQMKASLSKFIGIPVRVDHGHTKEFGLSEVGKVDKVIANDMLRSLLFEAEVTDEKAQHLVESKVLDSVSIKGEFADADTKMFPPVGLDYTPSEMSLTSSPACDFCSIFSVELTKSLNQSETLSNTKGEFMSKEEELYISKDDVLVEEDIEEGTDGQFELKKRADFLIMKRGKRGYIVTPGFYPSKVKDSIKKNGVVEPKYPYFGYDEFKVPESNDENLSAEPAKVEPVKPVVESVKAEPSKTEPSKTETVQVAEVIVNEPAKQESVKTEPVKTEVPSVNVPVVEAPKIQETPKTVEIPKTDIPETPKTYKFEMTPENIADLILGKLPPEKKV